MDGCEKSEIAQNPGIKSMSLNSIYQHLERANAVAGLSEVEEEPSSWGAQLPLPRFRARKKRGKTSFSLSFFFPDKKENPKIKAARHFPEKASRRRK